MVRAYRQPAPTCRLNLMRDNEEPERAFGRRARQMRRTRDWSQEDVARMMRDRGFDSWRQTTVAKSEAGDRPIRLNEGVALAHLFNGLIGDFIEEETREEVLLMEQALEANLRLARAHEEATALTARIAELHREAHDLNERLAAVVPGFFDEEESGKLAAGES